MSYRAFFSYSRSDDRHANRLHRWLDNYRTPKSLVGADGVFGKVPNKLHPIFRDRTDMSGGGELSIRIDQALRSSEALVVLCSPATASSEWVNTEVDTFIRLGRKDRIFPVIAPNAPDSNDVEPHFFPPALRGHGLLAADLREIKKSNGRIVGDGQDIGRLKLLAGLLGVSLDAVSRRERVRQRRAVAAAIGASLTFAIVACAAVTLGIIAQSNALRAEIALKRSLLPAAWISVERGDVREAVKLALAAGRLLPTQQAQAKDVLTTAVFEMRELNSFASVRRIFVHFYT